MLISELYSDWWIWTEPGWLAVSPCFQSLCEA